MYTTMLLLAFIRFRRVVEGVKGLADILMKSRTDRHL